MNDLLLIAVIAFVFTSFGAAVVFGAFWSVMRMGPPDGGDDG